MNKKLFVVGVVTFTILSLVIAFNLPIVDIALKNDGRVIRDISARPLPPATPAPASTEAPARPPSPAVIRLTPTSTHPSQQERTVAPYLDAPPCTEHDPIAWHGVWDFERGCHYAHTHNADPAQLDMLFGPVGAVYGGQTISYPWQTPHENEHKHEGYKWEVRRVEGCMTNSRGDNCIGAFRLLFHVVGLFGANFRTHSFWIEAQVCDSMQETCGIVKTGGWADFGILCVPYKGDHVPLTALDPNDPPRRNDGNVNCEPPPYRGHGPQDTERGRDNSITYTWNSSPRYGYNQIVEYDFQSRDDFGGINVTDPTDLNFVCPDFTCASNHSTMLVYEVVIKVPRELDDDGDGKVTYAGFNDRFGNIVEACEPLGPDCIPLQFDNIPVGTASFRVPLRPKTPHSEYDIYFCGTSTCDVDEPGATPAGWITYPN